MANIKIIDLPTGSPESTSFVEATQVDELAESGRSTVKLALNALGNFVAGQGASPLEYGDLETESTTLIGAANELHNTIGADAYDDTATYNTGDYCIYGGELYKCNDDNVTGAWDATKWDATFLVDELGGSGSSLVLPESIAAEYDDTASYTAGDFVMYQGILYKCNHISATGSFDPTKWDAISATDYVNSVKSSLNTNISQLAGDLSDAYSSSRTYAVGDLCILGNLLYKCNTAITTPEAWTPAHWTATTLSDEIAAKANSSDVDNPSATITRKPGVSNSVPLPVVVRRGHAITIIFYLNLPAGNYASFSNGGTWQIDVLPRANTPNVVSCDGLKGMWVGSDGTIGFNSPLTLSAPTAVLGEITFITGE